MILGTLHVPEAALCLRELAIRLRDRPKASFEILLGVPRKRPLHGASHPIHEPIHAHVTNAEKTEPELGVGRHDELFGFEELVDFLHTFAEDQGGHSITDPADRLLAGGGVVIEFGQPLASRDQASMLTLQIIGGEILHVLGRPDNGSDRSLASRRRFRSLGQHGQARMSAMRGKRRFIETARETCFRTIDNRTPVPRAGFGNARAAARQPPARPCPTERKQFRHALMREINCNCLARCAGRRFTPKDPCCRACLS